MDGPFVSFHVLSMDRKVICPVTLGTVLNRKELALVSLRVQKHAHVGRKLTVTGATTQLRLTCEPD